MALSNVIILSQIVGNIFAIILSLCISIPLIFHVSYFDGHCLLFTSGVWQDNGLFSIAWASKFYCMFPIITGFFIMICSAVQIYRLSMLVMKEEESSFLGLFVDVFLGICSCLMTLAGAIIITLGFIEWCSNMSQRFKTCQIADGQNITNPDVNIKTTGFYTEMGAAQFGAWGSFATWVGLSVFALLKLINNHQMNNLKVSMYLERQRLVNEDAFRENLSDPNLEVSQPNSSNVRGD